MGDSAPYENPLIPNARLRQMYLAIMRLRALEQSLRAKDRSGALGREACLVAGSIDLGRGDLVSDALQGPAVRFLRGQALHLALKPGPSRRRGFFSECGSATVLPRIGTGPERLWSVVGAAGALEAAHSRHVGDRAVILAYLRPNELPSAALRKALEFAADRVLPIVFLITPNDPQRRSSRVGKLSELARRSGVPGIAVDGEDTVAIYRVVQECLGRARGGGGPALIECVPFVLRGTGSPSARQTNGALGAIERYILERKIVTPEWIERETRGFARHLRQPVH
ncbi:MAG: hypothetical protein NVSMB62_11530 [Acidobacteriaceae bacterium]